mmetsp:Transcript_10373/g.23423  ORF Transcript_10373/g.23423 Transcript_10373/m.23423 type:complete len:154 (-) Transcript_10373:74-535(-)
MDETDSPRATRRFRAEVAAGPRGNFNFLPNPPRVMKNHHTWDSALVKKRLGWYPESDDGLQTARSGGPSPCPPSAPRPRTAPRARSMRYRDEVMEEPLDDVVYEPVPAESARYTTARARYSTDYAGTQIRRGPSDTESVGSLQSCMDQQWSLL